jgi:hypothetical protein
MCRVLNNLVKKRCSDQQSETNMNGVRMSMVRNLLSKKVDVVIGMANTRTDWVAKENCQMMQEEKKKAAKWPETSKGYGRGDAGLPSAPKVMVLSGVRGVGFGKGPKEPELLTANDALKPWDRIDASVRKRIKTEDVEDVMVKGTSEPSGGNLRNKVGVERTAMDDAAEKHLKTPLLRMSWKGKSVIREQGEADALTVRGREGSQPLYTSTKSQLSSVWNLLKVRIPSKAGGSDDGRFKMKEHAILSK